MAVVREKVVQNAERYVSRGKIEAAIKEYRKLLADNPNDISTLNRVGDLYARIHLNNEAIDLFTQIAEQYAGDGFFVKAIAIYKKIIKLDPTLLEVYEKLADLYHRQGLVNEARTQYQVLADYYLKHDRSAAAIGIYRRMAELEPEDPSHHVKLAELYRREDRVEEAMGEYRAIADFMLHRGKGAEAARVFERALDVDAEDLGFITDAVLKLKEGGHVGPAAHFLALAVARNPKAERVARIAGLPERPAPAREGAGEAAPEEPEAPPAAAAPRPELVSEPALTLDLAPPADEVFELDLDEDLPESLVPPPADMLADRGRPGAAWVDQRAETADAAPPLPPEPAPPPLETSLTGSFELDLDFDAGELLREPDGGDFDTDLDHELLERTAAEVQPEPVTEPEDLLAEAEVLAKYGIHEKALERLAELLHREPTNLEAFRLMIGIHLGAGRHERAAAVAARMSEAAGRLGDRVLWPEMRDRLEAAGFTVSAGRIEPPPAPAPEADSVDLAPESEPAIDEPAPAEEPALEEAVPAEEPAVEEPTPAEEPAFELAFDERFELPEIPWQEEPGFEVLPDEAVIEEPVAAVPAIEEPEAAEEPAAAAAPEADEPPGRRQRRFGDLDAALSELAGQFLSRRRPSRPSPAPPPPPPPAPEPQPPVDPLRALGDSLREEIDEAEAPAAEGRDPDDSGTSWLDEVSAAAAAAKPLEDEGDFFDLGAELEQELSAEGLAGEELLVGPAEQSLEEIVEGFKRGVAESLSPEDFDTHFNLGIAYREMGLVDEAIGEFQLAAREPTYLVSCASMLGLCFLEKGLPELAVKWYQRGLQAPGLSDDDRIGLLYDLGEAQLAAGDRGAAYHAFVDAYGIDSSFRDVVARLAELEPRLTD
ncbi:MAG TPA: tetratricopeptide repeat protein [Thermoanaerobaculia bacterium]|nr:tetratricopeptide repeat protein [Thermoanaerobaculia bacterium]